MLSVQNAKYPKQECNFLSETSRGFDFLFRLILKNEFGSKIWTEFPFPSQTQGLVPPRA